MSDYTNTSEEDEAWAEAERRMDTIGQNGPTGAHYPAGVKYDTDKPMMDLIPPLMEMEVARVLTVGAQKYSPDNWRQVPDLRRRYIAAAKRHINALSQGIARDNETALHHAAHAVCCLMFLGEAELENGGPTMNSAKPCLMFLAGFLVFASICWTYGVDFERGPDLGRALGISLIGGLAAVGFLYQ